MVYNYSFITNNFLQQTYLNYMRSLFYDWRFYDNFLTS